MQVSSALSAAGDSHPGLQRAINEDRYHFDPVRGILMVVDGVGGQAAGEKAAETALRVLRTRLERETGAVEDRVREAISIANNEVNRVASLRPEWQGMACVLTVAVVASDEVVIGHVGDTRLYKLRGGRIQKLTRDHSPVGEREDAGELPELDAMQHPRRNEVYRDIGSEPHDGSDLQFIDILRVPFEPDAALLLCSDGLTDLVPSARIMEIVEEHAGRPHDVVRSLITAANDAGGKDNVTVVYAEGPRFTLGEATRDLRARRRGADPGAVAPVAQAWAPTQTAAPASVRWRLVTLTALLFGVAALAVYSQRDRFFTFLPRTTSPGPTAAKRVAVRPGESIAAAIQEADAGSEVVVEPGEYRERLALRSGVHVVSRVPRGASIRLPGGASETDPAIVAFDIAGAALSGFRVIGDAATPLGIGIVVRNSDLALSDIEITGAHTSAIEYAGTSGGSVVAAHLHDNPGAAIVVRTGASPRIAHSVFARNATSERAPGLILVEAGGRPVLIGNTFEGVRPESVVLPPTADPAALRRDNWFINPADPATPRGARPRGRGGR